MKDILTAPFVKEMCDTTANMYRLGWDERNGGNISYLLDENEVAEYLDLNHVIRTIPTGFDAPELIGKIFIVTGTGSISKMWRKTRKTISALSALQKTAQRRNYFGDIRMAENLQASYPHTL